VIRGNLRELVLYSAGSAGALVVDVSVLALLTQALSLHYLIAASIAFLSGAAFIYAVSVRLVFRFRRVRGTVPELAVFIAIGVIGLGVNAAAIAGGVELLNLNLFLAKACAAVLTFCVNFVLRKLLLFTPTKRLAVFGDLA